MIAPQDPYQVDSEPDSDSENENENEHETVSVCSTGSAEGAEEKQAPVGTKRKKPFWTPKHIAYVKGLPYSAVPDEYTEIFSECGETLSITEQLDDDGKWTGCLFVKYATEEGMNNAIAVWNEAIWKGNFLLQLSLR
jgi:RNA recognition motif-containing protein